MEAVETCVEDVIRDRIECFDTMVGTSDELEIAGHFTKGEEILLGDGKQPDAMNAEHECFKIINHNLKNAVLVDVDTVIRTHPREMIHIIDALKTGITTKLFGVTRIVGYYSRIANWNSSKIGELADRRNGNYWESRRVNTEKLGMVVE